MLRFIYVIIMRIFSIIHYCPKMAHYGKHPEKYSDEDCHALAQTVIRKVKKTTRISTEVYGLENLPKDGGYMLFSNHQGKYDALGIIDAHPTPCSVLMDKKRSQMPIANQFVTLLRGKRLEKTSLRQQIRTLREMAEEVESGRNYLVFPEGGYTKDQKNNIGEFKYGCFITAIKAKCPVVPVVIIDSYKPFGENSLKPVKTKVVFLPPIVYEEYKDMKAPALCEYTRQMIVDEMKARAEKA